VVSTSTSFPLHHIVTKSVLAQIDGGCRIGVEEAELGETEISTDQDKCTEGRSPLQFLGPGGVS
jgi:hypothetical protein